MATDFSPGDLDFIDDILAKYGNDDAILDASELDGFLTAIVSGPDLILPSQWLPAVWGGEDNSPAWESQSELTRFIGIVMAMMNSNASALTEAPESFAALFNSSSAVAPAIMIVEEWCSGYMRGVHLGNWPDLPDELANCLGAIALHGLVENLPVLEQLTLEEYRQTVAEVEPAVLKLHQYWLSLRAHLAPRHPMPGGPPMGKLMPFVRQQPKIGPNEPCRCGSGRKYKKCCGAH